MGGRVKGIAMPLTRPVERTIDANSADDAAWLLHRPHTEEKEVVIMRIFAKVSVKVGTKRGNNDTFYYDATLWAMNMKTGKLQTVPGAVSVRSAQVSVIERMTRQRDSVYLSVIGGVGSYLVPPGMLDDIPDGYFWLSITDIL